MAFANLFTRLSAVDEEVSSPGQPAFPHRNGSDGGRRGNARKRKSQGRQPGSDEKKQCYQAQTSRTYNTKSFGDDDSKAIHYHMGKTDREHASIGFTKEVMHTCSDKSGHMYHKGQNYKAKKLNNCYVNKQELQKKKWGQKNQHHQKNKGGHISGCGRGRHQTRPTLRRGGGDGKQDDQVKPPRFMTQEFKEQNALLVNGQLLCRHFLWGKCLKGDDCQLKHMQGYNDLLKEVCKFYVQGFCMKGESCPYMHKSFPCKFYHRRGMCSQGADCRFSHEPLNEITKRLLDEVFKREKDMYELAKKAEQESSEQPANTDEPEIIEANRTPDNLSQPLRHNFYNSGKTNAEKEALLCQTEEPSDITGTAVPPQASDHATPHRSLSTNLNDEEPVCYSVEAVLGPQLFKPFPSFFTSPGSQEPAHLSCTQTSSDDTSGLADQSKVPYSVDAFDTKYKSQEKIFKSLPSLQEHTDLISTTCPDFTLASGDHEKQGWAPPEPAQGASHEVKLGLLPSPATVAEKPVSSKRKGNLKGSTHLPVDIIYTVNCKKEGMHSFAPTKRKSLTFTPKHPTQLKPHPSGPTSNSQALVKPLWQSSDLLQFKGETAVPAEPVTRSAKTRHNYYAGTIAECSSKMKHYGNLSVGCKKTQKTSFHSLFASPITDSLMQTQDFLTAPACPQGFIQASCPTLQSAQCRGKDKHVKTAAEPDKNLARPFLSLFAAPLSIAPLPCMQSQPDYSRTAFSSQESNQSADSTSHFSDSKQKSSNLETLLPHQVKTDEKQASHRPTSPNLFHSSRNESGYNLSEPVKQPKKLQVNPVCSLVSDSRSEMSSSPTTHGVCADPSTTQAHQQLPNISSTAGSAAAPTTSVLKTLFLCLSPYQLDGEQQDSIQISVPSESENIDKSRTGFVFVEQQRRRKRKRRRKKKFKALFRPGINMCPGLRTAQSADIFLDPVDT